jgi:antibiotic biosynthesis monooxygenase (ABM) superfamily enzyme
MISRVWHGWTKPEHADTYEAMLRSEILPGIHRVQGFRGATLLRRQDGAEVEFVTITRFDDMAAVRAFAGEEPSRAVYYPEDERFLIERDNHVNHYEVVFDTTLVSHG